MKKVKRLSACLIIASFFIVIFPLTSYSIPITYSVEGLGAGLLAHEAGHLLKITGSIVIDDIPEIIGLPYADARAYTITRFSLSIDTVYTFSGTGSMYVYTKYNENSWNLFGTGDWSSWIGDQMPSFYHEDFTPYDPHDDFSILPPIIRLGYMSPLDVYPGKDLFFSDPNSGLWLTLAAPVPEPTTILLSGLGLLGMGAYIRKRRTN